MKEINFRHGQRLEFFGGLWNFRLWQKSRTYASISTEELTKYSLLNSYSAKASCFSSHESSKAVRMGSLLDKAMREGEARAL